MLFIVYLSFHEHFGEQGVGNFSCVVEADSVEGAVDRSAQVIEDLHQKSDAFDGVREIYLEEIVRIKSVPPQGFVTHWQWAPGATKGTITAVLPDVDESYCDAFGPRSDAQGEPDTSEPFLTLD